MKKGTKGVLSAWLDKFLKENRLSIEGFAKLADISVPAAKSYRRGKRQPPLNHGLEIAARLGLSDSEWNEFVSCLDGDILSATPATLLRPIGQLINSLKNERIDVQPRLELSNRIEKISSEWQASLGTSVKELVLPMAGWQTRDLPIDLVARLLTKAVNEGMQVGIEQVTVVVAPGFDKYLSAVKSWNDLRNSKRRVDVKFVEQPDANNLLHAVLLGALHRHPRVFAPIALAFGDEFLNPDPLKELIAYHQKHQSSIVTLFSLMDHGAAQHGFASTMRDHKTIASNLLKIDSLGEGKPPTASNSIQWRMMGRYVLAPSALTALKELHDGNSQTRGFGDALESARRSGATFLGLLHTGNVDCPSREMTQAVRSAVGNIRKSFKF